MRFSTLNRHFSTNELFIAVKRHNLLRLLGDWVYILPADLDSHRQDRCSFSLIVPILNSDDLSGENLAVFLRPRFRTNLPLEAIMGRREWQFARSRLGAWKWKCL